jgi:hypothetical protein
MNKDELLKENKKLKDVIRELKSQVKTSEIDVDSLPQESFTMYKDGKSLIALHIKFNPETGEFVVIDRKDLGVRIDKQMHVLQYHLVNKVFKDAVDLNGK